MKNYLWNMFASLKSGQMTRRSFIYQKRKKISESFLRILWDEGFVLGYKIDNNDPSKIKIFLKYIDGRPVVSTIKLVSKPGRRVYYSIKQIWKMKLSGSLIIFSTNKGLQSIHSCKKLKIGGELFLIVY